MCTQYTYFIMYSLYLVMSMVLPLEDFCHRQITAHDCVSFASVFSRVVGERNNGERHDLIIFLFFISPFSKVNLRVSQTLPSHSICFDVFQKVYWLNPTPILLLFYLCALAWNIYVNNFVPWDQMKYPPGRMITLEVNVHSCTEIIVVGRTIGDRFLCLV